MSSKAEKLFEKMQNNKTGWRAHDFHTLYLGFGFNMVKGKKHDIFIHSEFTDIRDTIPRHTKPLGPGYAKVAVKNIELLRGKLKGDGDGDR